MKVLVAGGLGAIGRRYAAILENIGVDVRINDTSAYNKKTNVGRDIRWSDKVLIATPTNTHMDWIKLCHAESKPFLVEKPVCRTKQLSHLRGLINNGVWGNVVCNYKFALQATAREDYTPISYDYYNIGNENKIKGAIYYSCCQLIYINPDIKLNTKSPIWNLEIEWRGKRKWMDYRTLEMSYFEMLHDWLFCGGENLWTLKDGVEMGRATYERMVKDGVMIPQGEMKC